MGCALPGLRADRTEGRCKVTNALEEVTVATAAKVLRSLLQGRTRIFIAGDCHLTRQTVDDIAALYEFDEAGLAALDQRLDDLETEVRLGRGQQLIDFNLVFEDEHRSTQADSLDQSARVSLAELAAGGNFITALPASKLFVDSTYQRPRDDGRVARMVAAFDITQLGVLEVSERADGTYAVVEGQHRWHAAKIALAGPDGDADPVLVCKVHRGLSVAQEAALFFQIDRGRKPLNYWDRYKSRRAAGEPLVAEIEACCARHGFVVDPGSRDGNIAATGALEKIMGLGDATLLDRTLSVIRAAFNTARDGVSAELLSGVALILANYDVDIELNQVRLVETLQDIAPRQIRARAVALREANRAELPRLVAAVIVDRYNARPGAKLEPLLTRLPATSRIFGPSGRKTTELARVRRWARRNDLPVSADGTIPLSTRDAYDNARSAGITR